MRAQLEALKYLRLALDDADASFREGQWETIAQILEHRRVLLVQRTGWGKSIVYFLATKLMRSRGAGPTLVISPLLALMRNQLLAAERVGLTARMYNSGNRADWSRIVAELHRGNVDLLMTTPEQLGLGGFRSNVLPWVRDGLLVVDEAHCISDWGHDFRPDYRRIVGVVRELPSTSPVLATTATANDRVVADVKAQLGEDIAVERGPLARKSLRLQNIHMPSPAARLAWLAQTVPRLPGSGIIYTLTVRDADVVAEWLRSRGLAVEAYHAGIKEPGRREALERKLLNGEVKALVATVALGMGFDKPDLGFVVHFQRPASVVHYYQQVGRAGRALDEAYGVLLCGEEDDGIADFFMRDAFPSPSEVARVLDTLKQSETGVSTRRGALQAATNLPQKRVDRTITYLSAESVSPIANVDDTLRATPAAHDYTMDEQRSERVTRIRRHEREQMREYMSYAGCLMAFLQSSLDDPSPEACGRCVQCCPEAALDATYDSALASEAGVFLRRNYQPLAPRSQWPAKRIFEHYPSICGPDIPPQWRAKEGRALSLWQDAGWGQLVARGKYETEEFDDELVEACAQMLAKWSPRPYPEWVTCIPSRQHPDLVPDFAGRLARSLGLPFVPCIEKTRANKPQKEMEGSYAQVRNLDGVFRVTDDCRRGPCLLVDDVTDSGWTFTVAACLLRQKDCSAVYPLALALNCQEMA